MMFKLYNILLIQILFFFTCLIDFSHAQNQIWKNANTLWDLWSNDELTFRANCEDWSSGWIDPFKKYTFCNNSYILGGYNILSSGTTTISKTFTSLPSGYNMAYVVVTIYGIDSIDQPPDYITVQAGSASSVQVRIPDAGAALTCGNVVYADRVPIKVHLRTPYTAPSLTVSVNPHLDSGSTDESYGFRDVFITFYNTLIPFTSSCVSGDITGILNACPCPTYKFYEYPAASGNCLPCEATCATCNGGTASNCLTCMGGRYISSGTCQLCDSSCDNCTASGPSACSTCIGGKFLTTANTCINSCPDPLTQSSSTQTDYCKTNCPSNWVYWDKSCENDCHQTLEPLNETLYSVFKICSFPCLVEEYLYWNGSCKATCPSPLTQRTKKARLFCDYGCTDTTKYLYWDKDCTLSTCDFPLSPVTEGSPSRQYCRYKCLDTEYLYWNGSCIATCDFPLTQREYKGKNFCDFTCANISKVLYWDGTCQDTCAYPLTLQAEGSTMVRYYCRYKCEIDEFLYWNGTCISICVPPLTYSYVNGKWLCNYPCTLPGQYLRWDGVCQSSCPSPYQAKVEAGLYYCEFPCPASQPYLYWNETCSDICPYPLTNTSTGSAYYCNFPCNSATDILYWNGTCATQCNSPLVLRTEGVPIRSFCDYKCTNHDTEYLYWNGSCLKSCSSPLDFVAEAGLKYCRYPCLSTEYLYWNGSCSNLCPAPLATRTDASGKKYCDFPCNFKNAYLYWNGTCSKFCLSPLTKQLQGGTDDNLRHFCVWGCTLSTDYLYWTGTCQGACNYPLISAIEGGKRFCRPPCPSIFEYYYPDTMTCKKYCDTPYTISYNNSYAECIAPLPVEVPNWVIRNILTATGDPGAITLVTLPKLMQYTRYLDIQMSPRLNRFILSQGRNILSPKFGWSFPSDDIKDFPNDPIPGVFQRHNLHSSFIVNFWPLLTSIGIAVLVAIVFSILEKFAKMYKYLTWQSMFESLRLITRWSFPIIIFATYVDDIILYSYLQFRTFSDSYWSDYTVLSLLVCLGVLILVILLVTGTALLAMKAENTKNRSERRNFHIPLNFLTKWRDFQILFRGFKTNIFINRLFYIIYLARIALPLVIAATFYQLPLVVVISQLVINVLIMLYVLLARPLTNTLNMIQLLVIEFLTLLMNICVLTIMLRDFSNASTSDFSYVLGDVVIFLSFIQNILILVFLGIKILRESNLIGSSLRGHSLKEKAIWLQLLSIPLQQAGMGFEEMTTISQSYIYSQGNEGIGLVGQKNQHTSSYAALKRTQARSNN